MSKRRNYDASFEALAALEAVKGERTGSETARRRRPALADGLPSTITSGPTP
ncbi:hypothetical protein [Thioclava pacifica]|uniref:Transposase n=1 Tax=Thioclava pacifica DSM 10166 TaxID=1353537 RepID=A0A074JGZ0_9RHOB|nr:hypothetical protein [Thioclava pacifica]KEO54848.1 hypothetical protein TP2_17180 [Thioclava pacifica DSM 10166]